MRSVVVSPDKLVKILERDELLDIAERLLAGSDGPEAWQQWASEAWVYFEHRRDTKPLQGWKLHVSATAISAAAVTAAVLPILFRQQCSFKIVRSTRLLGLLSSANAPRGSSGKFITTYPFDIAQARQIAALCDEATRGLQGPAILSDRAYRPDGLVYYRYGAFRRDPHTTYDAKGLIVDGIRDPEGRVVADSREAWFWMPPWIAEDPFQPAPPGSTASDAGTNAVADANVDPVADPVVDSKADTAVGAEVVVEAAPSAASAFVLGDRYEVVKAIRHANKGGVYSALDRETGQMVIVKEARPLVGVDLAGRDVTDGLRAEAANLKLLSPSGVAPQPIELFAQSGHLFLVIEHLPGQTLWQYRRERRNPLPIAELLALARAMAGLLATCHEAHLLVRDFNPNNLIVLPDGDLRLIDVEMACLEGVARPMNVGGGTPGFASPQQTQEAVPERADDDYSLAATLFFLITGRHPYRGGEKSPLLSRRDWLAGQLAGLIDEGLVPPQFAQPILCGMSDVAEERWSAARVLAHLATASAGVAPAIVVADAGVPDAAVADAPSRDRWIALTRGLTEYALESIDLTDRREPVRASCPSRRFDPCCVQCGAAGVGMSLLPHLDWLTASQRQTVHGLAQWVGETLRLSADRPQGLYFGSAGAAWFLLDAGTRFADERLLQEACTAAASLHPVPGQVDVTHGASGIGMTWLHFHRTTGRAEYLDQAVRLADEIVATGVAREGGLVWPHPDDGGIFYGFAHGNAGVAYFLLCIFAATRQPRYLAAAEAAARILLDTAEIVDDCAYWAHGPNRPSWWTYWCNGSSGIGTTLIRLYQVTANETYRTLATMAADAVWHERYFSNLCQCHGLAGNGEFLLDMHRILREPRYRARSEALAEVLYARRIYAGSTVLFPDDDLLMAAPDYGIGTSGIAAFYHRLTAGTDRLFMVDAYLDDHGALRGAAHEDRDERDADRSAVRSAALDSMVR